MFPDNERFKWFDGHSRLTIERCKRMATSVPGVTREPVVVYVPGGDNKYPSFFLRDAVMQCRSGFISLEEMENMLKIILTFQNGQNRRFLKNGLRIDPWSIPEQRFLYSFNTRLDCKGHKFFQNICN